MIDFLRGIVVHTETDYVVIDVRGIGYRVFCAHPYNIQAKGEVEQLLYIHHHVRDDALLLYGFQTREEQTLFRKLLDVSGIGPRVAIGILSGSHPEGIIAAIQQENVSELTKLPGIGKKTAQRMILDLKDKLDALGFGDVHSARADGLLADHGELSGHAWNETKAALLALGYTEVEVNRSWQVIKSKVKESDPVDVLMKQALQALYKG